MGGYLVYAHATNYFQSGGGGNGAILANMCLKASINVPYCALAGFNPYYCLANPSGRVGFVFCNKKIFHCTLSHAYTIPATITQNKVRFTQNTASLQNFWNLSRRTLDIWYL